MNVPSFGRGHSSLLIPQATYLGVESLGGCPPLTDVSSGQRALEREIQQLGSLQFPNSTHQTLGKS